MNNLAKRLYIVAAIMAVLSSAIWLMPSAGDMKPSRLARHLPMKFDTFVGERVEVTGQELKILAKDTEFERVQYVDTANLRQPPVEVSVVFSGKDLNNSIHRPERCLKSQGWNFAKERTIIIREALPDGSDLPVREIVCEKTVRREDGSKLRVMRVQFYTFFGHQVITEDHYGRTLQDMKDRLFKGFDQRWAYATFSMPVTSVFADQGLMNPENTFDVEETEKMLEAFIKKLAPLVIDRSEE